MNIEELDQLSLKEKIKLAEITNDINILRELSKDEDWQVRYSISKNPNTPAEVLRELIKDTDVGIKHYFGLMKYVYPYELISVALSQNENTPIDILEKLSDFDNVHLVKNINCPSNILEKLSYSVNPAITLWIARHANTPIGVLERLSKENSYIKSSIANNINCPLHLLETLSNNESDDVRLSVLDNNNVSKEIVEKLSQDKNLQVSSKAMNKLSELSKNDDYDVFSTKDKKQSNQTTNEDELSSTNKHKR